MLIRHIPRASTGDCTAERIQVVVKIENGFPPAWITTLCPSAFPSQEPTNATRFQNFGCTVTVLSVSSTELIRGSLPIASCVQTSRRGIHQSFAEISYAPLPTPHQLWINNFSRPAGRASLAMSCCSSGLVDPYARPRWVMIDNLLGPKRSPALIH